MSVRTMARVWDLSRHSGSELLMLLAIADFADDDGRAYPAVPKLAGKCRMSPRNANRTLASLRDSGELQVRLNEGPHGTNLYRIVLEASARAEAIFPLTPAAPLTNPSPLTPASRTPDAGVPKPLTPASDKPSLNHQDPSKRNRASKSRAQDPKDLFPDVTSQVFGDWLEVRKAKRAGPVTATVARLLRAQADKAELTAQAAIEICCHKGWQSFNAAWNWRDTPPAARSGTSVLHSDDVFVGAT